MEEGHLYGGGYFYSRLVCRRGPVSMQQPHLSKENKTHRTEQVSFNTERTFFSSV